MIAQLSLMESINPLSKINCVKFQKRTNKILLSPEEYSAPHPVPENAYGKTYGEHREFLEFSYEQHKELKAYCESLGLVYSSSVWDIQAAREISSLHPKMIKVPSASNMDLEMLNFLCDNYDGEIHISLGMTTKTEEEMIVNLFKEKNRQKDLVLYACTSRAVRESLSIRFIISTALDIMAFDLISSFFSNLRAISSDSIE